MEQPWNFVWPAERDWTVLLAEPNKPMALAGTNVVLNQIDLVCEISGASLPGILPSKYDIMTTSFQIHFPSKQVIYGKTWDFS